MLRKMSQQSSSLAKPATQAQLAKAAKRAAKQYRSARRRGVTAAEAFVQARGAMNGTLSVNESRDGAA